MFHIDGERLRRKMREKGFRSLTHLAKDLGIHRNSLHYFLSGRPVLPESVAKVLRRLDLAPADLIVSGGRDSFLVPEDVASVVDQLHLEFPEITFLLFGSRAEGRAQKYSDWDIGAYSRQGLPLNRFLRLVRRAEDLSESLAYFIQIVNLNRADAEFLQRVSRRWIFLTGRQGDWIQLQKESVR